MMSLILLSEMLFLLYLSKSDIERPMATGQFLMLVRTLIVSGSLGS